MDASQSPNGQPGWMARKQAGATGEGTAAPAGVVAAPRTSTNCTAGTIPFGPIEGCSAPVARQTGPLETTSAPRANASEALAPVGNLCFGPNQQAQGVRSQRYSLAAGFSPSSPRPGRRLGRLPWCRSSGGWRAEAAAEGEAGEALPCTGDRQGSRRLGCCSLYHLLMPTHLQSQDRVRSRTRRHPIASRAAPAASVAGARGRNEVPGGGPPRVSAFGAGWL